MLVAPEEITTPTDVGLERIFCRYPVETEAQYQQRLDALRDPAVVALEPTIRTLFNHLPDQWKSYQNWGEAQEADWYLARYGMAKILQRYGDQGYQRLAQAIRAYGIDFLGAFDTLTIDDEVVETLYVLTGSPESGGSSDAIAAILLKYCDFIRQVWEITYFSDPQKTIDDPQTFTIASQLFERGKQLLVACADRLQTQGSLTKIDLQDLDQVQADLALFLATVKTCQESGIQIDLKDFDDVSVHAVDQIDDPALIAAQPALETLIRTNYAHKSPEYQNEKLAQIHEGIEKGGTLNLLWHGETLLGSSLLTPQTDGSMFFSTFHLAPSSKGFKLAAPFFRATVAPVAERQVVTCHVDVNNFAAAGLYIGRGGAVVTAIDRRDQAASPGMPSFTCRWDQRTPHLFVHQSRQQAEKMLTAETAPERLADQGIRVETYQVGRAFDRVAEVQRLLADCETRVNSHNFVITYYQSSTTDPDSYTVVFEPAKPTQASVSPLPNPSEAMPSQAA